MALKRSGDLLERALLGRFSHLVRFVVAITCAGRPTDLTQRCREATPRNAMDTRVQT